MILAGALVPALVNAVDDANTTRKPPRRVFTNNLFKFSSVVGMKMFSSLLDGQNL
jgi:hypothetical protein